MLRSVALHYGCVRVLTVDGHVNISRFYFHLSQTLTDALIDFEWQWPHQPQQDLR